MSICAEPWSHIRRYIIYLVVSFYVCFTTYLIVGTVRGDALSGEDPPRAAFLIGILTWLLFAAMLYAHCEYEKLKKMQWRNWALRKQMFVRRRVTREDAEREVGMELGAVQEREV